MIQYLKHLVGSLNLITLKNQIICNLSDAGDTGSDRGFYQLFKWKPLKEGFDESKTTRKPIFLLMHKSWCPACQKLKAKISKSIRLISLSDEFVMINVEVGKDAAGNCEKFHPDGKYVPRILFFTADGDLIKEAWNRHLKADDKHKYFYSSPAQIIDTMLFVLKKYSKDPLPVAFSGDDLAKKIPTENYDNECENLGPTLLE